ncbi:uncharacterized protein LOC100898592 [Galendromus occidentalis]|uniref:Uncharacterized protein LOC100898592 n=1 Tax=Galendromus occidentalis TaxID=34638 RepID=A0AAJ6QQ52_9ACAR|nr:uncharacterized protein LOC100898592 [Galendromus occidentalis]
MSDSASLSSASCNSSPEAHVTEERTFTAEEMHFEGFDFVATQNVRDVRESQEARRLSPKRELSNDFAAVRCDLEHRRLRFYWLAKDLHTIKEIEQPNRENYDARDGIYPKRARYCHAGSWLPSRREDSAIDSV